MTSYTIPADPITLQFEHKTAFTGHDLLDVTVRRGGAVMLHFDVARGEFPELSAHLSPGERKRVEAKVLEEWKRIDARDARGSESK